MIDSGTRIARPRRDLVDVEVEPVGKENDLRRNRRHSVVVILPERTEIDLGEGVAFHHAAMGQHPLAAFASRGSFARIPSASPKGSTSRKAKVAGTAGIEAPTAVFLLVAQNLSEGALHAFRIARVEQRVQEDVIGLQHRVGFELPAPITVGVLLREQILASAMQLPIRRLQGPSPYGQSSVPRILSVLAECPLR